MTQPRIHSSHPPCDYCIAHAPVRDLSALFRAAFEIDEIADIVRDHSDLTIEERRRFQALRAAVRTLGGAR